MAIPEEMLRFLEQKYAIQQQQANASTSQAATQSVVGNAAALLDRTRAGLMPAESAANIAKTQADTGYTNVMAKFYPEVVRSEIGLRGAQARNYNVNSDVTEQTEFGLPDATTINSVLSRMMEGRRARSQLNWWGAQ